MATDYNVRTKNKMQNYESLNDTHEQDEQAILFHTAETARSKWTHIEDLDSFFARMYKYHQKHGFMCMLLQDIFDLAKFAFVIILTTYLIHGIDYAVLFNPQGRNATKVTLSDVILPVGACISNFNFITWCLIVKAFVIFVLKFLTKFYQLFYFWDIKQFYNTALSIGDDELDNMTWSEILAKIRTAQLEIQMCIHKRELTELDIYHRILRQENYMVAMVNKHLFPPRVKIPFLGEFVYWTKTLRYNIQGLLFWSPFSPFESPWQLREEYKKQSLRNELAKELGRHILWLALINLCLAPVIFFWQLLYSVYSYGELIKREPGRMGIRNWSLYSKLYFRHFNELDHELHARLTRAYRPAAKYLAAFSSPMVTLVAQYFGFVCGSLFTVIIGFTVYDEDVIAVEHVITIMTVLGGLTALCRSLIPDETTVWCPEQLLECVVMHTHYLPGDWKGGAHTSKVRSRFQELFQMSVLAIVDDLFSPLLTPFLMWRWVYPRSLEIVDFYRNFTVNVVGVGDVCSFAEMDVKKHGNPLWQAEGTKGAEDQYNQAEDGKVELSLVHFAATNPTWVPPPAAQDFIDSVTEEIEEALGFESDMQMLGGSITNIGLGTFVQAQQSQRSFVEDITVGQRKGSRPKQTTFAEPEELKEMKQSKGEAKSDPNLFPSEEMAAPRPSRVGKSVIWVDSSEDSETVLRSLRDNKMKSVAWLEGPDINASANMTKSTLLLHKRHAQSRMNFINRSSDQYQETTPLLERRPSR